MDESDDHTTELMRPASSYGAPVFRQHSQHLGAEPVVPDEALLARVHAVTRWSTPAHANLRLLPRPPEHTGTADGPALTDVNPELW
jgi:hypothetical protein